jgi:hypothetical protein
MNVQSLIAQEDAVHVERKQEDEAPSSSSTIDYETGTSSFQISSLFTIAKTKIRFLESCVSFELKCN